MAALSDKLAELNSRSVSSSPLPSAAPIAPPPTPSAELAGVLRTERIAEAERQRDRLAEELADARDAADAATAMLASAEVRWRRSEQHTEAEAVRLTHLRDEARASAAAVVDLERRLPGVEARIVEVRTTEQERAQTRRELVEAYAPVVQRLGIAVQALLDALKAEATAREAIQAVGAWSPAYVADASLGVYDSRGGDDLQPALTRWLADATQAGYLGATASASTKPRR